MVSREPPGKSSVADDAERDVAMRGVSEGSAPPVDDRAARRRNFLRLLAWNLTLTLAICIPLYFFSSLPIALGFLGLMLLMSFTLAGYFALLRV